MPPFSISPLCKITSGVFILFLCALSLHAQTPTRYEPTIASLKQHSLPQWFADAKLGIFIHWGLYSVPGWAPLVHPEHDFNSEDYITHNPYAEWYLNSMRLEGSPIQVYHREHYGPDYDYYDFARAFNQETQKEEEGTPRRTLRTSCPIAKGSLMETETLYCSVAATLQKTTQISYFFDGLRRALSSIGMKSFSVIPMATRVTRPTTSASWGWRKVRVC
jgi:hypothetical protein